MSTSTLRRAGDTAKVTHIGYTIEDYDKWCLILRNTLKDVIKLNILNSGNLSYDALVITTSEAIELLDGHLLPVDMVARHEVLEVIHKLTIGTLLNIDTLNLLARLDSLSNGANTKNSVFHIVGC